MRILFRLFFFLFLSGLLCATSLQAQTTRDWVGTTSADFNDLNNWSPSTPGWAGDTLQVDMDSSNQGGAYLPVISADANLASIFLGYVSHPGYVAQTGGSVTLSGSLFAGYNPGGPLAGTSVYHMTGGVVNMAGNLDIGIVGSNGQLDVIDAAILNPAVMVMGYVGGATSTTGTLNMVNGTISVAGAAPTSATATVILTWLSTSPGLPC